MSFLKRLPIYRYAPALHRCAACAWRRFSRHGVLDRTGRQSSLEMSFAGQQESPRRNGSKSALLCSVSKGTGKVFPASGIRIAKVGFILLPQTVPIQTRCKREAISAMFQSGASLRCKSVARTLLSRPLASLLGDDTSRLGRNFGYNDRTMSSAPLNLFETMRAICISTCGLSITGQTHYAYALKTFGH